jgi:hypothetical protein
MSNNRTGAQACVVKIAIVLIFSSSVSFALGQSPSATVSSATVSSIEPPTFRPRTDSMAVQDADAVRERLRSMTDSRGPINPLSEYGKPKPSKTESNSKVQKETDDGEKDLEALEAPSLDADAQRRLKAQPPTVSPGELSVIGLYPPPRMTTNPVSGSSSFAIVDDGFRPVVGIPISANYQISDSPFNDPAAMIPPSLGIPSGSVPSFNPPPIGSPATVLPPPSGAPLPSVGAPVASCRSPRGWCPSSWCPRHRRRGWKHSACTSLVRGPHISFKRLSTLQCLSSVESNDDSTYVECTLCTSYTDLLARRDHHQ